MKKSNPRASDAEIQLREAKAKEMLLDGFTRAEIVRECSKLYGVSARQIDDYIKVAREEIAEINQVDAKETLSTILKNQWKLFRKAVLKDNDQLARQILMDIAKLKGLEQINVNHVIEQREFKDISDEELDKLLSEGLNSSATQEH